MNMIYDRMVQIARENAQRSEASAPSGRTVRAKVDPLDTMTFSPVYQTAAYALEKPPKTEAPEMPPPERLFGDPPPRRDWGWLLKIGEFVLALFMMGSLCVLVLLAAAAASAGKGKRENLPVPVEVEK